MKNQRIKVSGVCFSAIKRCAQVYGVPKVWIRPATKSIYRPPQQTNHYPLDAVSVGEPDMSGGTSDIAQDAPMATFQWPKN